MNLEALQGGEDPYTVASLLFSFFHRVAVRCRALQGAAGRCRALQGVAVRRRALQGVAGRCSAVQGVAVHCIALQCVAVRCSALQCVAVRCSALQCVAVHCSALQCVAGLCSQTSPIFSGSFAETNKMIHHLSSIILKHRIQIMHDPVGLYKDNVFFIICYLVA